MSTHTHDTHSVLRFEVRPKPGQPDPKADALRKSALAAGFTISSAASAKVYLVEGPLSKADAARVLTDLLADPVIEVGTLGATPAKGSVVEVHPQPGVMDPAAQSVREAIRELTGHDTLVSTGARYDLSGIDPDAAVQLASGLVANPVIHQIVDHPWLPDSLPQGSEREFNLTHVEITPLTDDQLERMSREAHLFLSLDEMKAVQAYYQEAGREPTDIELETLAQTWSEHCVHKTLKSNILYTPAARQSAKPSSAPAATSPTPQKDRGSISFSFTPTGGKMDLQGQRANTPAPKNAPASSRDVIRWSGRPGHTVNEDGSVTIANLLKSTVAAATFELIKDGVDWTLSVFKDNSGVIAFDDEFGVCIKVETHNRPSAIEPYGGAATGIGGCIRDVIGTGLGAKPIASTDVFCVAHPNNWDASNPLPPGALHPRRILTEVVAGVRDYGNRMGIPTVAGGVHFDDRHVGNPLVFAGCVGLIPRSLVHGKARPGDRIIALGGRTGRDGIHGATFSSAELESSASTEFAHAVQIGNAIEEKRVLDAILRARDAGPLYSAITDCGAGGFSSAVGEMGGEIGAEVNLEQAPLKYAGLSYTEIWISEAQERMVLAVAEENIPHLQQICNEEGVEIADLGVFGTENAELILLYHGNEVGRLSMHFLHEGIPTPTREASWPGPTPPTTRQSASNSTASVHDALLALLAHPSIASKHWIIRQYDHEVQGQSVLKPLVGPGGRGPGDASVIEPRPGSNKGIALSSGLQNGIGDPRHTARGSDPYHMAIAAIDECVRNLVCVGADPARIAILDNFCWPSCEKPENLGMLVRACAGCYDGAKAYRTPFVSGKDSLNNQLRYTDPETGEPRVIEIPPTLLISGIGIVQNLARCTSMDAKKPGNMLVLIGRTTADMGGSTFQSLFPAHEHVQGSAASVPAPSLETGPATARAVAQMIKDGLVHAAHDCSEGGLLVAVSEMLIATTGSGQGSMDADRSALASLLARTSNAPRALGADLSLTDDVIEQSQLAFAETPHRYIIEIKPEDLTRVRTILTDFGGLFATPIGKLNDSGRLRWTACEVEHSVNDLAAAWLAPLDW